jgi:MFS family permease
MTAVARISVDMPAARRAVAVVFLMNGVVAGSWAPHVPLVKARLELSEAVLGGALLAMGAGALAAMVFASVLIERFGGARVVQVSGVALALWLPAVVLIPSLPLLVAALAVFGAIMGTMDVSMNAGAVAVERAFPRPVMSSFHGMWSVGGLAGAALGGIVLESFPAGVHLAGATLVALALAAWSLPRLLAGPAEAVGEGNVRFAVPGGATLVLGGLAFLSMMSEGAMLDWSAVYLAEVRGADTAIAAAAFAAFSGTMALGRFLGDRVRARFSAVRLAVASGAIAAAGFAVAGLGIANLVPLFFSAAGRVPGASPSRNLAAVATTGYTGFLVGPVLIGGLSEIVGLGWALLVLPAACLLVMAAAPATRHAD